jgi:hypothetical protein
MGWEVFTTAPDQVIGEAWCELIRNSGIDCKLQPGDSIGFLGVSVMPVRLMVPEIETDNAKKILDDYLGENASEPHEDE